MSLQKSFRCVNERTNYFSPSARMAAQLKGSRVPAAGTVTAPISGELQTLPGFQSLHTYYPGLSILSGTKQTKTQGIWLDHIHRVIGVLPSAQDNRKSSGVSSLRIERNESAQGVDIQDVSGFRKITHLVDPVRWIQGEYGIPKTPSLPWSAASWGSAWKKLQDPMNQAHVEALATYGFGKLRELEYTPHFHHFYGAFCSIAEDYAYNITDSYMSYRHCRWFWNGQNNEVFKIGFEESVPDDVRKAVLEMPEDVHSGSEGSGDSGSEGSEGSGDEDSSDDIEELGGAECPINETASLHSIHSATGSMIELATETGSHITNGDSDDDTTDDDDSESDDLNIFAEIKKFPVMMIYTESSEGTMDDLLDDYTEIGAKPGTPEWDTMWSAWIFQVVSALCAGQTLFGFTHNDLHSNNIVWSRTDKKYLYYSTRDGVHFAVPTFGKIFRLIDFGRSIFTINDKTFYSDDFRPGNDAADQYNFGDFRDKSEKEVLPNPSFDLSRFTVSIFESLFPCSPQARVDGALLSREPGLEIWETKSDLYNLLWSWLLCDDGHNVLMEADGKERYPDFDLYKIISTNVHGAVPSQQIRKPVFEVFRVEKDTIPGEAKLYSLFC